MIALYPFVNKLLSESVYSSTDGGPGEKEPLDDTSAALMKQVAKPAGADVGKGPDGIPTAANNSSASGVRWGTAFKKGSPMSQEKGDGSTPPNTVDGPSKDNPNTFLKK